MFFFFESAVAVSQKVCSICQTAAERIDQVQLAVQIQIHQFQIYGTILRFEKWSRAKSPIAISKKDTNTVVRVLLHYGHGQINSSISIDVSGGNSRRLG